MDKFLIEGGQSLKGKVKVKGSKNSALPILAATLLCEDEFVIENVPHLRDIYTMKILLVPMEMRLITIGVHCSTMGYP